MCRLSRNSGASTSWNPKGLSRPVAGKLCKSCLLDYRLGNPDMAVASSAFVKHVLHADSHAALSALPVRHYDRQGPQINFCNWGTDVFNRPRLLYNAFIRTTATGDLRNLSVYFRLQSTCSALTAFRQREHGDRRDLESHYQVRPFMRR
jgi:hypothetical protein